MTSPIPDPEWWLRHLVVDLVMRQPHFTRRGNYVEGIHAIPKGDRRYMRALSQLQKLAPTNYIGLVTQAPVQRMNVRGFHFGSGDKLDSDAANVWVANDMDMQSDRIHGLAAKYGLAYTLVSPPEEDGIPIITAEDPRTTIVYRDPTRPTRVLAGLRMWTDDFEGRVLAVLYLPDAIYHYVGPEAAKLQNLTIENLINTLLGMSAGGSGFELDSQVGNPLGEVPLVEYVWKPDSSVLPEGEAGLDVMVVQDRINATILDRIVISRTQAYKQRFATGVAPPKRPKNGARPDWDPGSDVVWISQSKDAKFGEFTAADIRQVLEAIRDDVSDIAAITQTPAHYLMGKIANISGETLTQAETGLVKKTKLRMKTMGWSHERTMKLCFAYMNDSRATEVDAEVLWDDPEQNALVDLSSAAAQLASAKIPLQLVMERLGFTQEQIDWAVKENERIQQQQMDQQLSMAKATAALSPSGGNGGSPAKPKQSSPNSTKKKPNKGSTPGG